MELFRNRTELFHARREEKRREKTLGGKRQNAAQADSAQG